MCKDKIFPYIKVFSRGYGPSEEPRIAYFLTYIIAILFILIGGLLIIQCIRVMRAFGVRNRVADAFSVSQRENAPEKCVFTNNVPPAASESEFDHTNRIPGQKVC